MEKTSVGRIGYDRHRAKGEEPMVVMVDVIFDRQFGFRTPCNSFTDLDLGVVTWCVFRPEFASESPWYLLVIGLLFS